ncbi:MAG TPA: DinB family protein [Methylomirabilota bacterium]|nr:DinB family protein [Methylomirabilota bacterium]
MALPKTIDALWSELQAVRADVLAEVAGLAQRQADWRPAEKEWSVGEVLDHLAIVEVGTGKLTSKLLKAAGPEGVFPPDLDELPALPDVPSSMEAPALVWPQHGQPIGELLDTLRATRERSRQSVERLAGCDPRSLVFKHFRLGDLDLLQWWRLVARHDRIHLAQIRAVKAAPGFPGA